MHRIPAKLECPEPAIDPGGTLQCQLLVYNPADRVDEVTAVVQGEFRPWVDITPAQLPLLPKSEGAFDLTVALPADARLEAGPHPLLAEARSGLADTEPSLEEIDVDVARRTGVTLSLHQRPSDEPAEAVYEVRVHNDSNHPISLALEVEARLSSRLQPHAVDAAPFQTAVATLTLQRNHGDAAPADVAVRARGTGVDVQAREVWTPTRPWSRPTEPEPPTVPIPEVMRGGDKPRRWPAVLGALFVVAAALLAYWFFESNPGINVAGFEELEERPSPRVEPDSWEWTWQDMLLHVGFGTGADGFFGPATERDTINFQARHGLPEDGTVQAEDWERMLLLHVERNQVRDIIGWRVEPAIELLRQFGIAAEVADRRRCATVRGINPVQDNFVEDVVVEVQSTGDELLLVRSNGTPC